MQVRDASKTEKSGREVDKSNVQIRNMFRRFNLQDLVADCTCRVRNKKQHQG